MPRKPMNSKRRKIHDLSIEQLWVLIRRHDFLRTFRNDADRREVWRKNKKYIVGLIGQAIKPEHCGGLWANDKIYFAWGERPDAWWRYDAPEKRQLIPGSPCWEFTTEETYFGLPCGVCGCKAKNYQFPEYESQFEYLQRLDLLLPGEAEKYNENLCTLPV